MSGICTNISTTLYYISDAYYELEGVPNWSAKFLLVGSFATFSCWCNLPKHTYTFLHKRHSVVQIMASTSKQWVKSPYHIIWIDRSYLIMTPGSYPRYSCMFEAHAFPVEITFYLKLHSFALFLKVPFAHVFDSFCALEEMVPYLGLAP